MAPEPDTELLAEFEAFARRAGIEILEDRRAPMIACYRDYKQMLALLHGSRPAVVESASVFAIESIKRAQGAGEFRDR